MSLKSIGRELLPPLLARQIRAFRRQYGCLGDYPSWEAAAAQCSGYAHGAILARVRDAALKVKAGAAAYERDSVLYQEVEHSWPLLAALMHVAAVNGGVLRVVDFGRSLGTSYIQNRRFLQGLSQVKWCVVEQEHFVRCGKEHFEDEALRFYSSIDESAAAEQPDIILFSSVLQYLPNPYEQLRNAIRKGFPYILIDRTGFSLDGCARITVQKVNPAIYPAAYPCHFFARPEFCATFQGSYELLAEFPAIGPSADSAEFRGFLYRKTREHSEGSERSDSRSV